MYLKLHRSILLRYWNAERRSRLGLMIEPEELMTISSCRNILQKVRANIPGEFGTVVLRTCWMILGFANVAM